MSDLRLGGIESQWGREISQVTDLSCPSAMDLIDFVEMGEAAECFGTVVCHLPACEECRRAVLEMRSVEDPMSETSPVPTNPVRWWQRRTSLGLVAALPLVVIFAVAISKIVRDTNAKAVLEKNSPDPRTIVAVNEQGHKLISVAQDPRLPSRQPGQMSSRVHNSVASREPSGPLRSSQGESQIQGAKNASRGYSSRPIPGGQSPLVPSTPTSNPGSNLGGKRYCLVGAERGFILNGSSDQEGARKGIELDYADAVARAEAKCQEKISQHADPSIAEKELQMDLQDAAKARDDRLGKIYPAQSDFIKQHDELKSACDGPYQLVEVQYSAVGSVASYVILPPWPGYQTRPYYWEYHHRYRPIELKSAKSYWLIRYRAKNRPAFVGLVGHQGYVAADTIHRTREGKLTLRPYLGSRHIVQSIPSRSSLTPYQIHKPEADATDKKPTESITSPQARSPYTGAKVFRDTIAGASRGYSPSEHIHGDTPKQPSAPTSGGYGQKQRSGDPSNKRPYGVNPRGNPGGNDIL